MWVGCSEELLKMPLEKFNVMSSAFFFFSENSRDPRVLRSVQKYHVFQRFYGNSLESVSSKLIVPQNVKGKRDFGDSKNKKTHVSSKNYTKQCCICFS